MKLTYVYDTRSHVAAIDAESRADADLSRDIWALIARLTDVSTPGARYANFARKASRVAAALSHVRTSDQPVQIEQKLMDVVQSARVTAHSRLSRLVRSDDAIALYRCDDATAGTECEHSECATYVTVDGREVTGWTVTYEKRCSECALCRARKACQSKTTVTEDISIGRVIGGALKSGARQVFPPAKDETPAVPVAPEDMPEPTTEAPAVSGVPARARALMADIARQCADAGEPVIAGNGSWSVAAGNRAAADLGFAQTERGRRSARAAILGMR